MPFGTRGGIGIRRELLYRVADSRVEIALVPAEEGVRFGFVGKEGAKVPLTFSYSRALQNPALGTWKGQSANVAAAQRAFYHRAHMNGLAAEGKWKPELEKQAA